MATRRIDIRLDSNNKYYVEENKDFIIQSDNDFIKLTSFNWIIIINHHDRYIYIESLSKAKSTRTNKFYVKLSEGSLFLYNSTTDWYWYFREKEIQEFLDEFNIGKLISIPDERKNLTFHQYFILDLNGEKVFIDSLDRNDSTMLFHSNNGIDIKANMLLLEYNLIASNTLLNFDVKLELDKFILTQRLCNGYRKLYIKSSYNVKAAMEYFRNLEKIEFTKLLPDDKELRRRIRDAKINWK